MRSLFDMTGTASGGEIVVDLFAGGGGASEGIRMALGRDPEAAVNHNPLAVAMHAVNHPGTVHFTDDVWSVSPSWVTQGRKVGLLWASPDCTHFSKAKGGAPIRNDRIRSLAMVLVDKWIPEVRPRVIIMENVEEMTTWGPLDCRGRIIDAAKGDTFRAFIRRIRRAGYAVEWRELRACDYGAPTIRKRLFLIARCDGQPIVWPAPTHGDPTSKAVQAGELLPWRTAAECIDWSIPCPSIFDTSEEIKAKHGVRANRPLAEKTLRRIAEGIRRYVLEAERPFVVNLTHGVRLEDVDEPMRTVTGAHRGEKAVVTPYLTEHANGSSQRNFDVQEPLRTQCAQVKGGHFALVSPLLEAHYGGEGARAMRLPDIREPLRTMSTENRFGLVSAFLAKHFTGVVGAPMTAPAPTVTTVDHNAVVAAHIERQFGHSAGNDADAPLGATTAGGGGKSALVASNLVKLRGDNVGQPSEEPLATVSAGGTHHAEVRAFLCKYYGQGVGQQAGEPMHTVTALDRFGLVIVAGQEYVIADIGMRMLQPRELFRAQGFPDSYIIDRGADGRPMTKTDQVRMCGNSVCPPMAAALVAANVALKVAGEVAA